MHKEIRNISLAIPNELKSFLLELMMPDSKPIGNHSKDLDDLNKLQDFELRIIKNQDADKLKSNVVQINKDDSTKSATSFYDANGAATYIVVVIVWYFLGVVAFVTWQMSKKKPPTDYKSRILTDGLKKQAKTKQILEELRNPKMRKWAWSIYRRSSISSVKLSAPISPEYEKQMLAYLDKKINKIEKEKLKLQDDVFHLSDFKKKANSPYTTNEKLKQKDNENLSESKTTLNIISKLKEIKTNASSSSFSSMLNGFQLEQSDENNSKYNNQESINLMPFSSTSIALNNQNTKKNLLLQHNNRLKYKNKDSFELNLSHLKDSSLDEKYVFEQKISIV